MDKSSEQYCNIPRDNRECVMEISDQNPTNAHQGYQGSINYQQSDRPSFLVQLVHLERLYPLSR